MGRSSWSRWRHQPLPKWSELAILSLWSFDSGQVPRADGTKLMRSQVLNNVRNHGESWEVSEEWVVCGRSRNWQPDGFGWPIPRFRSTVLSRAFSAAASNVADQFPVLCQDDLQHSFLVSRAFRVLFLAYTYPCFFFCFFFYFIFFKYLVISFEVWTI